MAGCAPLEDETRQLLVTSHRQDLVSHGHAFPSWNSLDCDGLRSRTCMAH